MAMTKAERAEVEKLREQLAEARAMCNWPTPPKPVANVRERYEEAGRQPIALFTYNACSDRVMHGCTTGHAHSITRTDRTETQAGGGPWYETKLDALLALRAAKTAKVAADAAERASCG